MEKIISRCRLIIQSNKFVFFILFALIVLTYRNLIFSNTILDYDDKSLIYPLLKIDTLKDYFLGLKSGLIIDLQPIRDLSYFTDIFIKKILPFYTFHITNIVLWAGICTLAYAIFFRETNRKSISILLLFLYCFSPVSTSSVAWIAARKHLLSTFFILFSTLIVFKEKEKIFKFKNASAILVLYVLSSLSQPINSLWPIWMFFFICPFEHTFYKKKLVIFLTLAMTFFLCANAYYYSTFFPSHVSIIGKFVSNDYYGSFPLALGRYFFLCLFPFSALPTTHSQASWENLAGLFLLCAFVFPIFKKSFKNRHNILASFLYFLLPLVLVSSKTTNIFCSDTYLLNASVGFYLCFAHLLSESSRKNIWTCSLILYIAAIFTYNLNYTEIFSNESKLWFYSYAKEVNSQSSIVVASTYLKQKKYIEANLVINEIQKKWPTQPFLPQIISEKIFYNAEMKNDQKISELEKMSPKSTSTFLYLTILYGRENQHQKLHNVLDQIFRNEKNFMMEYRGNEEKIAAIYDYTCEFFHVSDCEKSFAEFKKWKSNQNFDQLLFQKYLENLKSRNGYTIPL